MHSEPENTQQAVPTLGDKLCRRTFNPSGDEKVARLKQIFAEAADIVSSFAEECPIPKDDMYLFNTSKGGALRAILDAQFWSVYHVTTNIPK